MTLEEGIQSDIERISKTVADLMIATTEPGFNQAPAIAQYLSQFYTGLESFLENLRRISSTSGSPRISEKLFADPLTLL